MKKIVSMLLCLAMLGGVCAFAEGEISLGTVGNARAAYSVSCQTPKQFTVFHKQSDNQTIEGMLANDKTNQASYLFVIAMDNEYAGIESLGAPDAAELEKRTSAYREEGLDVTVKEKNGEKYLCLADKSAKKNTYASIETIIHGCLIQISISPVEGVYASMTEKQAQTAVDFLATLTFEPAEPIPGEEEEAEEESAEAEEAIEETISDEIITEAPAASAEGWATNREPLNPRLTEKEQQIFDRAAQQIGMDYEPLIVLATQVVAGTNYAYLCREKEEGGEWIVVTVYNNLSDQAQVLSAHMLVHYHLLTADRAPAAGLSGGWTLKEMDNGALLPEKAQAAFSQAMRSADKALSPVALLGSYWGSGYDYLVLARDMNAYYLVTVHAPLTGDASVADTAYLDLLAYVSVN